MEEGTLSQLWRFWIVPIGVAPAMAFLYAWLGAEDGVAECDEAARHPVLEPGELTRGSRGLTWTTNGDMLGLAARRREDGRDRRCDCPA